MATTAAPLERTEELKGPGGLSVRRLAAGPLLLCLLALTGCSGFSIGVRQDKDDRAAMTALLAGKRPGARFPAKELLLNRGWKRLYVFRGGIATQPIEDRIGIPFPQSGEATPKDASYLVFGDDDNVISAFSFAGPPGVGDRCLIADRVPLKPDTELTLVPGERSGTAQLSPSAAADRCR